MKIEEEYNMLNKRIHFSDSVTAAVEFVGLADFDGHTRGLPHRYPCWDFTFITKSEGVFYFGEDCYVVKEGTGILIPPFIPHCLANESSTTLRNFYVGFDGNFIPSLNCSGYESVLFANKKLQESFFTKSLYEILFRITDQVDFSNKGTLNIYRPLILANIISVFVDCFCSNADRFADTSDTKMLKDVRQIILNNMGRNVSAEEIAHMLYLSQRHFSSKFTNLTGMSFKEYENMIKMEEASQMLYTTNKTISQISDELGFCDIHYFSRKFKAYYGCSPTVLRKKKGVVNDPKTIKNRSAERNQ